MIYEKSPERAAFFHGGKRDIKLPCRHQFQNTYKKSYYQLIKEYMNNHLNNLFIEVISRLRGNTRRLEGGSNNGVGA
jgi:hypothetical protein